MSYREILRRAFEERLTRDPPYSQSAFARDLGLGAPQLNEVLRGKKGLSRRAAHRVAAALGFSEEEQRRFCDLVDREHGRSLDARRGASERLGLPLEPPKASKMESERPARGSAGEVATALEGTWWITHRHTSAGPVSEGWSARSLPHLWSFEGQRFAVVGTTAGGELGRVEGSFELQGRLLLLHPSRETEPLAGRLGAARRHYVDGMPEDLLTLRTPGSALPDALCQTGQELRSTLERVIPRHDRPEAVGSSGSCRA
jgi:plasmid maintenance system antidote protein VapI